MRHPISCLLICLCVVCCGACDETARELPLEEDEVDRDAPTDEPASGALVYAATSRMAVSWLQPIGPDDVGALRPLIADRGAGFGLTQVNIDTPIPLPSGDQFVATMRVGRLDETWLIVLEADGSTPDAPTRIGPFRGELEPHVLPDGSVALEAGDTLFRVWPDEREPAVRVATVVGARLRTPRLLPHSNRMAFAIDDDDANTRVIASAVLDGSEADSPRRLSPGDASHTVRAVLADERLVYGDAPMFVVRPDGSEPPRPITSADTYLDVIGVAPSGDALIVAVHGGFQQRRIARVDADGRHIGGAQVIFDTELDDGFAAHVTRDGALIFAADQADSYRARFSAIYELPTLDGTTQPQALTPRSNQHWDRLWLIEDDRTAVGCIGGQVQRIERGRDPSTPAIVLASGVQCIALTDHGRQLVIRDEATGAYDALALDDTRRRRPLASVQQTPLVNDIGVLWTSWQEYTGLFVRHTTGTLRGPLGGWIAGSGVLHTLDATPTPAIALELSDGGGWHIWPHAVEDGQREHLEAGPAQVLGSAGDRLIGIGQQASGPALVSMAVSAGSVVVSPLVDLADTASVQLDTSRETALHLDSDGVTILATRFAGGGTRAVMTVPPDATLAAMAHAPSGDGVVALVRESESTRSVGAVLYIVDDRGELRDVDLGRWPLSSEVELAFVGPDRVLVRIGRVVTSVELATGDTDLVALPSPVAPWDVATPDGQWIAASDSTALYGARTDGSDVIELLEASSQLVRFTPTRWDLPDEHTVLAVADGHLMKVAIDGSRPPLELGPLPIDAVCHDTACDIVWHGATTADGARLYLLDQQFEDGLQGLWTYALDGSDAATVTAPALRVGHTELHLAPDGESVIFTCASPTDARLCQWHPDDAEPTWLTPPDDTTERLLLVVE